MAIELMSKRMKTMRVIHHATGDTVVCCDDLTLLRMMTCCNLIK